MKFLKLSLIPMFVFAMMEARAAVSDFLKVHNVPNSQLQFGTWAFGDGGQSKTATFCLASANYSNAYTDPPPVKNPPAVHELYQFKVEDRSAPAGFFMYLGGDDGQTGNAKLAIEIEHRDTKDGNSWQTLTDDNYDSHVHEGQFKRCKNGKNAQVRVSITSAELEQARAGLYRGFYTATGRGGSSGTSTDSDNFRSEITIADIVRINGLADVSLGTYAGSGDINVEESFCAYSNNSAAAYELSITSPNQDISDNFFLKGGGGTDLISYSLYFDDSVSPGLGTEVVTAAISGTGNNAANDCGGADNAKLSVRVLDGDMSSVPAGSYSDTLTVLVAPI